MKIKNDYNNKLFKISYLDKFKLLYYNPYLINLYQDILKNIKFINIYSYKSYITFSELNLSHHDLLILDWFGYINGIIKLTIDTFIKLLKNNKKINTDIFVKITDNIKSLKIYYNIFYKKINMNHFNNNLLKIIKNKKIIKNTLLCDLYLIYYIHHDIFKYLFKNNNNNHKLYKYINKYIHNLKEIYLLNNRLNNNNKLHNNKFKNDNIFNEII